MKENPTELKREKNLIIVVESLPDYSMGKPTGVPKTILFLSEIIEGPTAKIAVTRMHRDYPVLYTIEHFQGILSREERIGRIIVDPKPW